MSKNLYNRHCKYHTVFDLVDSDSLFDSNNEENKDMVSIFSVLPDDLLERVLAHLPIASIFRARCVCKRWNEIVSSNQFSRNFSSLSLSQKPWYFMFMGTDESYGYAYDPALRKWHSIDLPYFVTTNWFISSSFGLICFMNNASSNELHVYNPITKCIKSLISPPGFKFSDYNALAISADRTSHSYQISIVKSKQVPENFYQWDMWIHLYDSKTMMWVTSPVEVFNGRRAGDESVICDGYLYFMLYPIGLSMNDNRHGLIQYNLSSHPSHGLLMKNLIVAPCPLTCGRLVNLNERLVLVGGIGKHNRSDIIRGIGIWVLDGLEWLEVARMPHKFFQGFGELDDVFASSGLDDVIYIHSYGAPALLLFDMKQKQWRWAQKCPVAKKFALQLFTGFCFEPRLDMSF